MGEYAVALEAGPQVLEGDTFGSLPKGIMVQGVVVAVTRNRLAG